MWKWILLIVIMLAAAGGTYAYLQIGSSAQAATPQATAKVEHGRLRISVSSTGKVVSNRDVDIKCKASGEVKVLPFDISDQVHTGDVLLQVDTIEQTRAVQRAQAALDASTARVAQAKQNLVIAKANLVTDRLRAQANLLSSQAKQKDAHTKLDRVHELLEKKLASQEDFDTATTSAAQADADLKVAEAQIEELKAEELGIDLKQQEIVLAEADLKSDQIALELANQQLGYTTVTAPIDGVVTSRTVQIGTIVQSGTSSVSAGTTVMTISDLSHIYVYASVDESDIGRVQVGQKVTMTADAHPGVQFEGSVVRIAAKGVNSSNVVTYEVRIEVTSANKGLLKPEMTANVEIINIEKEDVLLIPTQAFTKKRGGMGKGTEGASNAPMTEAETQPTETQAAGTQAAETQETEATTQQAAENREQGRHKRGARSGRNSSGTGAGRNVPTAGTVTLLKTNGVTETVDVVVGLSDGNNYEVLSGLTGSETVVLNKSAGDSRWRPTGGGRPPMMMR